MMAASKPTSLIILHAGPLRIERRSEGLEASVLPLYDGPFIFKHIANNAEQVRFELTGSVRHLLPFQDSSLPVGSVPYAEVERIELPLPIKVGYFLAKRHTCHSVKLP